MIETEIKGIDLSKYQKAKKVDFKALRSLNYRFAIIRAGFGMYDSQLDPQFDGHIKAANAAGISCGAYHYSYAVSVSESKREADCFLKWIKGKRLEYPVAFDIEDKTQKQLSNAARTDIALEWLNRVESEGYYTMIYSSANWLSKKFDMERLKHFDVWVACYTTLERRREIYDGNIGIWQKQSELYLPSVYVGRLDENIAYKDYASIIKRAKLNGL